MQEMKEMKELYQLESGEWALYPYLITCTYKNIQEEKYTDDLGYYENFEELYDDFTIDKVEYPVYTAEQTQRLKEVQGLKYKDYDEIYEYVINNTIRANSKIFAEKIAEKNRADIDYISIMTGVEL